MVSARRRVGRTRVSRLTDTGNAADSRDTLDRRAVDTTGASARTALLDVGLRNQGIGQVGVRCPVR